MEKILQKSKLPNLLHRLTILNRRLAKLGMDDACLLSAEVTEEWQEKETLMPGTIFEVKGAIVDYVRVEISGDMPQLNGWSFAGTAEDVGGKRLWHGPGADQVPDRFKVPNNTDCQHCNVNRDRVKLCMVRNVETGEWMQVGTACLKDFLGHNIGYFGEVYRVVLAEDEAFEGEDPGQSGPDGYDIPTVLKLASLAIIRDGGRYVKSQEWGSTKVSVCNILYSKSDSPDYKDAVQFMAEHEEGVSDMTKDAVAWLDSLEDDGKSDFNEKLIAYRDAGYVTERGLGLMCYVPMAAKRAKEKAAEKAAAIKKNPDPISSEFPAGKRHKIIGKVVTKRYVETDYGCGWKARIETESGNRLWGSVPSAVEFNEGDQVELMARIKESPNDSHFGFWSRPTKAKILQANGG